MTKEPFVELVKKYGPVYPGYGEVGFTNKNKKSGNKKIPKQNKKRRR